MKCEICHERDAEEAVHRVVDGVDKELYVCHQCAEAGKAGEKKAREIKVKPEGAKVTFTSSDSKIVKVTKDGTIKGIKAGKATITVKAAEGKAELKIKVVVK